MVSEFKDFIAVPKFNLYQSLHTAVAGADGQVAEVLIRTHQMHKVAEAGVIALGNPYATLEPRTEREPTGADGERVDPTRPGWLSRLLDWQEAAPDPDTFWSTLREDLAQDREITVFRADGGTLGLPAGASCVDAAYAQYGEDAHACIGARVNGRLATLSTVLRDGDTVQLLMAQDAASGALQGVAGARPHARRAHRHPRGWLADASRTPGRRAPRGGRPRRGRPRRRRRPPCRPAAANAVVDQPGATVRLAGCCTPVPPDEVTGFAVRGGVVTVHRVECAAVARMKAPGAHGGRGALGGHHASAGSPWSPSPSGGPICSPTSPRPSPWRARRSSRRPSNRPASSAYATPTRSNSRTPPAFPP